MHTHTLLLVDDSTTIQEQIRSALADEPIEVVVAINGHLALDHIEAIRPAVVLASTTALGMDGYGLAHYVSQRPYLSNVSVLLLTGSIGPADPDRMKESGARGFIRHPFESGSVRARVREVLMLAAPGLGQADVLGQLGTAFDAIDASMTSNVSEGRATPHQIAITPEALQRIVNDAVTQAIAAYEQGRNQAPARPSIPGPGQRPPVAAPASLRARQEQLQREMGLDDIEFKPMPAPAPPTGSIGYNALAAEMGVDDFAFEEAESPRRVEAGEHRGVAPVAFGTPLTVPPKSARIEESPSSVMEPLRDAVVSLRTALAGQAGRFRSALAERARRGELERDEPTAAWEAPPPVVAPDPEAPAPAPEPGRPSLAQLAAMTPEEAAQSVFFTFDPIPPVPAPIPREPDKD